MILWDEMKSSGKLSLMPILYIELGPESHMREGLCGEGAKTETMYCLILLDSCIPPVAPSTEAHTHTNALVKGH